MTIYCCISETRETSVRIRYPAALKKNRKVTNNTRRQSAPTLKRYTMDLDKFFQETNFEEAEKNAEAIVEKNDSQAVVEQAGDNDCGDGCKI